MEEMIYILPFSIDAIELITIFIGIYHYKKYKDTLLKYFLWFLCYGFITEMLGIVIGYGFKKSNYIVFNVYAIISYFFFYWLFYNSFKNKRNKHIVSFFILCFTLVFIIDSFFFNTIFDNQQYYTLLFGSISLIVTIILFFIEILNSEAILKVKHLLIFWVAVGLLLFQLGFIPVFLASKYINYSNGLTYGYILLILNFITSLCYSLGFIWTKKNLNY